MIKMPKAKSLWEETLARDIRAAKLDAGMVREYRFAAMATGGVGDGCKQRLKDAQLKDWRLDFAWPDNKLAVEVEGGIYMKQSRHITGSGFNEDAFKYNALTLLGWRLLRVTSTSIKSGMALRTLECALGMTWTTPWEMTT